MKYKSLKLIKFILYLLLYNFRSGITVTESLLDAINDKTMKLIRDKNLKRWLDTVTTVSVGHIVEPPKGLIKTLNLISSQGPNGNGYYNMKPTYQNLSFMFLDKMYKL